MSECAKCHTPLPVDGRFCSHCGTPSGEFDHRCPADPVDELRQRLARTLAGRYEITRLLGRGGMAVVFLAEDLSLERQVAIKVLPPELSHDAKLVPRFQQEAKTAAKLDHPNIIPIYRVESEAGLDYFVMKYVAGRSLEQVLEEGPLPIDLARRVLREAALALGHAHQRRIVHRDVKPANIMLDTDGRVILTDFGISKAVQSASQLTGTGTIIGTPHYMSPEQAKGLEVDGRADQYSLAVVGHQILTGKQPFDGSAHSILYKHVFEPPPPVLADRADVPHDLSSALARALSKEPEQRFATMEEFAVALGGDRRSGPRTVVTAAIKPLAGSGEAPLRPKPAAVVRASLIALGICLVVGGAAWAGLRGPAEPSHPSPPVTAASPPEPIALPVATPVESVAAVTVTAKPKRAKVDTVSLTVTSEPWGILYLDDVEIGPTPVADYPVLSGRHRLRIEQEGYRTRSETIVVTGPAPIRREFSLEPAGPQ
ncbi:MAG TPA: protein kinase [Gemmatimonadales bacterium]|nr:protein kinase [Gemmatimonadales bacterium]